MNLDALTTGVLRFRWGVLVAWVVILGLSIATIGNTIDRFSQEFNVPGREGAETNAAIERDYGTGGGITPLVPVVQLPEGTTVEAARPELTALFDRIQAAAPAARVASWASTGDPAFVSADGRTTFGLVYVPAGVGFGAAPEVAAVEDVLTGATVGGAPVVLTSLEALQSGGQGNEGAGTLVETLIAAAAALVILSWVFGSLLAIVPLLIAGVAILATFLVLNGVTRVTDINFIVEFIVALIGLGVAIDYSLLVVTRWREERDRGLDNIAAVRRSMTTSGRAVIFSGITVAVGLLALIIIPVPVLRGIGIGGMLIPLVSVVVTLTLLPVLLATIGPALDRWRLRKGGQESTAWRRWGALMVRRRWLAAGAGLLLLAALLVPATQLRVGDPEASGLPGGGEAGQGLALLESSGIGPGPLSPYEVLTDAGAGSATADAFRSVEGVRLAIAPDGEAWQRAGSQIVAVVPVADAASDAGDATLDRLRSTAGDLSGSVRIGGVSAQDADFIDVVYGNFPLMVALIALVTFLLLVWAFRSILLPIKAIILNVLSVGAAYGILVLVWQDGFLTEQLFGTQATGSITSFIPLVVFAFLFGLSMDYEVFILARTREEVDHGADTDQAIVRSLGYTGRLVTSAALILFFAFVALGAAPVVLVKVLATGLAAGILLDATVVRALLVPATVSLLGRWNWWLPAWLERRLPAGGIEGPATPATSSPAAGATPAD